MINCLVHTGDSNGAAVIGYFFQGLGVTAQNPFATVPQKIMETYYGDGLIARNMCIAGSRLNTNGVAAGDLVPIAPLYVDPIIPVSYTVPPFSQPRKYVLTCAIGSNDGALGGLGSVANYAAAVAACCVARKTAGYARVAICTLLPRNDGNMLEVNRLSYNTLINDATWRANNGIDGVIDLAGEPTVGNPANCSNTEWYSDGVHYTAASGALLAPIWKAGVDALIAMP